MGNNTNNLSLYKADPVADKNDTFNITKMLNENWDKIDETVGNKTSLQTTDKDNLVDAINEVKQVVDQHDDEINKPDTIPFSTDGKSIESNPPGTRTNGLFSPDKVESVKSVNQNVNNGDFSNGTANWFSSSATLSVSNNVLTMTGNGSSNIARTTHDTETQANSGDTMFFYAKLKVTNSSCDVIQALLRDGTSGTVLGSVSISNPVANQEYEVYKKFDSAGNTSTGAFMLLDHFYADSTTANGKVMEADGKVGVFTINMTADGIQNYTEEQMLNLCRQGYWEGLKTCALNYELKTRTENIVNPLEFRKVTAKSLVIEDNWIIVEADGATWQYAEVILDVEENTDYSIFLEHQAVSGTSCKWVATYDYVDGLALVGGYTNLSFTTKSDKVKLRLFGSDGTAVGKQKYRISLVKGSIIPSKYTEYDSDKTEFSVPEEYPFLTGSYIDANRDYHGKWKKYVLQSGDISFATNGANVDLYFVNLPPDVKTMSSTSIDGHVILPGSTEILLSEFDNVSQIGNYYDGDTRLRYIFTAGATLTDVQNALAGKVLYYQTTTEKVIKDGHEGFQAPKAVETWENGDLVVTPKKKIVLDGKLNWEFHADGVIGYKQVRVMGLTPDITPDDIKYVTKLNGIVMENIKVTFTDGDQVYSGPGTALTTDLYVTLNDSETGWAEDTPPTSQQVKDYWNANPGLLEYYIDPKHTVNPIVSGNVQGSLIAYVQAIADATSKLNDLVATYGEQITLLMAKSI